MASLSSPRLVVVGSCMIDLMFYLDRMPKVGETLHALHFAQGFGGKGANQAVMMGLLSPHDVGMVARVGDDAFGEATRANFAAKSVDARGVMATPGCGTGMAPIMVDSAARNAIVIAANANARMSVEDVQHHADLIRAARVLVTQLEIPLAATLEAMRIAKEAGVCVIFNPAPAVPDLPSEAFALCDFITPNETETELLTGMPVASEAELEAAGRALLARGAANVIMTLGERGALWLSGATGKAVRVPAPVVAAVDTTGAGDCFMGAFAVCLARGMPVERCIERANLCASVSVTRAGTQTSFPQLGDLPADFFTPVE